MKVSRTVWSRGKDGDNIKVLPIAMNHWNGNILDSKETVLRFAQNMTYKGMKPTVNFSKNIYNCGKKAHKKVMELLEKCVSRKNGIEKWFVTLEPDKIKYAL